MPRIQQELVKSVFYLYRDNYSATAGLDAVGTGFIVAIVENFIPHYYGVSNKHVVCSRGGSIARLNSRDGRAIFEFGPEDWEIHGGGDDIAAVPLALDPQQHEVSAIPFEILMRRGEAIVGVGDDVFMLGLFADHEDRQRNNPMARFGNISMLASPDAPVKIRGQEHECHIVDMHSRSGFSGSPVFVYRTFGADFTHRFGEDVEIDLKPIASLVHQSGH
jgi:hypothetical protein